jgi:hypothetical protein
LQVHFPTKPRAPARETWLNRYAPRVIDPTPKVKEESRKTKRGGSFSGHPTKPYDNWSICSFTIYHHGTTNEFLLKFGKIQKRTRAANSGADEPITRRKKKLKQNKKMASR